MSTKRLLIIFVALAIFLRLGSLGFALSHVGVDYLIYGDANEYLMFAKNMSEGHGFASLQDGEYVPQVFRAPGLPFILTPFMGLEDGLVIYLVLLSVIAGVLVPLLVYGIGRRIFNERVALIAAAIAVIEPNFVFYSFLPISEMPFMLFMLGGFYLALRSFEIKKAHIALLTTLVGGLLLGYSLLIRPQLLQVFGVLCVALLGYFLVRKEWKTSLRVGVLIVGIALVISPWMLRNHSLTGTFALSGLGWRNVYTNYLGSVRALENKSSFDDEKVALIQSAREAGIDVGNPANADILRDMTIPELWEKKGTVLKLETFLLASFVMHDGYYYTFRRFGFIPDDNKGAGHSVSFALLSQGVDGIPVVFAELKRQFFIPIAGRLFTIGTAILALVGAWLMRRNPWTYFLLLAIGITALASTAIGFGVEARMRFPVAPFIFLLAGVTIARLYSWYETRYLHPRV